MKRLIILALLHLSIFVYAQEKPPITYEEVVKVDSVTKEELFIRARSWFNSAFKSSKDVLNINDKETGELTGKVLTEFYSKNFAGSGGTKGVLRYSVTIQVKEGRYKYLITNFIHESTAISAFPYSFNLITEDVECPYKLGMTTRKWRNNLWKELQGKSRTQGEILAVSIKDAMNKVSLDKEQW